MLPPNEIILDSTTRSIKSLSFVSSPRINSDRHLLADDIQAQPTVGAPILINTTDHLLAKDLQLRGQVSRPHAYVDQYVILPSYIESYSEMNKPEIVEI